MPDKAPQAVLLAGSTVEVISALACIDGLGLGDAALFVERNISFGNATMGPLLEAARSRFPSVRIVELEIQRPAPDHASGKMSWMSFVRRWNAVASLRKQLDVACHVHLGMGLSELGSQVQTVYFNVLHDYVLVFLAACRKKPRVIYPHGFDQPSRLILERDPYLHRRRSVGTAIKTLKQQQKRFCSGGLAHGLLGRLIPGVTTVCLPFTGSDKVVTFRSGTDPVSNEVLKLDSLAGIFRWLLEVPPWSDSLRAREGRAEHGSLLLLLSECNRDPIWERNRNYGQAHLQLLQAVSRVTGLKRMVIKAHVRSDGSAAEWLTSFLREHQPDWEIEILPLALSGVPVEALSLTGEFAAACSLGSCSLPPGLGFGMVHFVSLAAAAFFDAGWVGEAFWVKYKQVAQSLIEEEICRDVDGVSPNPASRMGGQMPSNVHGGASR